MPDPLPSPPKRGKLLAYDFADRRKQPCYKCGGHFPEGRYREHVIKSKHPAHLDDKKTEKR